MQCFHTSPWSNDQPVESPVQLHWHRGCVEHKEGALNWSVSQQLSKGQGHASQQPLVGSMQQPLAGSLGSLAPGPQPCQGLCQGLCRRRVSDEPWQQCLAELHNERGSCHADMDWDLLLGEISDLQRDAGRCCQPVTSLTLDVPTGTTQSKPE